MAKSSLITLNDPRSSASEAYRSLRTNLVFSSLENTLHTVLVTSPAPGEGKSTALANLAVTMAQSGKRTLIVDTDLRRPTQHEIWGIPQEPGLTNMIVGDVTNPPIIATEVESLSVLPTGARPPNPADLLGSARMAGLIETIKAQADFVLFDAPPIIAVTDAALLAAHLDGVLLVLRAGSTRREHAAQAKEQLDRLNIRIIGSVLLNAQVEAGMGSYYTESGQ
ncbi:MAG: CpsD/CapB family tyrosine-protein kinase [Chloroflexi bacterium]|nr:CpsD/CapB family tyrosine-protein kinase [Chloroflexota bacterium]